MPETDAATPRGIDPRGPRFVAGITSLLLLAVVFLGLLLPQGGAVTGFGWFAYQPLADRVFTAAAFVAAFLNAVFGVCLGCMLYLLLQRLGVVGRPRAT